MKTTFYQIGLNKRIAQVSDLHSRNCQELLIHLKQAKPDYIFVTGDTFERKGKIEFDPCRHSAAYHLFKKLAYQFLGSSEKPLDANASEFLHSAVAIAPVYLSLGNHEWYLRRADLDFFASNNIVLLDNRDVESADFLIGGLSSKADEEWLKCFKAKASLKPKLLLCHHPEYFVKYDLGSFDVVFSGHAHGGQLRIAGHSLYAPGQGFWPKITRGVYFEGHLVVSGGVANTLAIPRFNNETELVIVD